MGSSVGANFSTFGLSRDAEGRFFSAMDQVMADPHLNGQAHYMRRAFQEMKLDGILCIDGKPTVYLKDFTGPVTRLQVNKLHKQFWNQGTATLLVIQDPNRVLIFSGMVGPSNEDGEVDDHKGLIEKLDRVADTLEAHRFLQQVASGHYYRKPDRFRFFNAEGAVDRYLLKQLGVVSNLLCHRNTPTERKRVHELLGRVIFTCYLIDREIIFLQEYPFIRRQGVKKLVDLLRDYPPEQAKRLLYKLFTRLKSDFNGSMFDEDLDTEQRSVSDNDIDTLKRFFEGQELEKGQHTFGFWAFDFSVIPVETISAIYEKFLEEEDAKDKEAKGAFYTPKHLAEMVVDEAVGSFETLLDKKYLDPACGSGVFLVILFNRLAEEWRRRHPKSQMRTKARELLDILEQRLCGVDVNLTACRIACFSLYIAFLDQFDPPKLREFQEKTKRFLPKLLAYERDNYKNTETPAIFEGNFFDPKLPIADDFDVVLGNPPWVGRNQPSDKQIDKWVFGECNPYLEDAPRAKDKRTAIFLPQRQIAHAFMWKAPLHLREKGVGCLLLPTKVLHNKTDAFQGRWFSTFSKVCVDRILQLADYSFVLFAGADCPSCVIRFSKEIPDEQKHRLEFVVPKVRRQDPRSGLVPISPEDRKWIALQHLLDEARQSRAAVVWKTHLWGTERDVRFLDYLLQLDTLGDIAGEPDSGIADEPDSGKRWVKGHGFQPWYQVAFDERPDTYGEPKPIPGRPSDPFVKTVDDNLQMFVVRDDCISLRERLQSVRCRGRPSSTPEKKLRASMKGFRRSPDERLFQAPLVLINNGFTKFSFVDFDVFYQDSLTGIGGEAEDEDLLRFFTVYAKSKLAAYFLFHTASSWGTERDRVLVHELMRLPFPLPDSPHSSPRAKAIVSKVASRMRTLQQEIGHLYAKASKAAKGQAGYELRSESIEQTRRTRVEQLQAELEPLVYEYFELSDEEIALVEDTCNVYEPSSTPTTPDSSIRALEETTEKERLSYSSLLCDTLNEWSRIDQPKGRKQPFYLYAESACLDTTGMVLVTIGKAAKKTACREVRANGRLDKAVTRIADASTQQRGAFEYLRGIIFGDGDKIRIFKPDLRGHWTKTSALNDADAVFQAIIQSKRRRR